MDIRKCEVCGKQFVAGYGYSIAANWLVTGSAFVSSYMCEQLPGGQHWGCTPEHAMQALDKCLKEHMHVGTLQAKHQAAHRLETRVEPTPKRNENQEIIGWEMHEPVVTQRPRYSDEDGAAWAEEAYKKRGEDFHIVEVKI